MKTRRALTKARNRSEKRFRLTGLGAVLVSLGFLVLLLSTIVGSGLPAFTYNYAKLTVDLSEAKPDAVDEVDYATVFRETTKEIFPQFSGRKDRRLVRGIFASGSDYLLQKQVAADPSLAGGRNEILIPVSDFADLYLKGLTAKAERSAPAVPVSFTRDGDVVYGTAASAIFEPFIATVKGQLAGEITALENRVAAQQRGLDAVTGESENAEARRRGFQTEITKLESRLGLLKPQASEGGSLENLTGTLPSLLIRPDGKNAGAILRARSVTATGFTAEIMIPFETEPASFTAPVELLMIEVPESDRKFSDREVAFMEHMRSRDMIETGLNDIFFSAGASREAETAGIWGAVVGSFLTLVITLALSFPIGVAAALYLEEFAPKNRITDFIEVNINNLAAVPSIVFGLLGLAVFLNWFNLPRSAPLVGGLVLALMTLPTIIIASRAALKAVPPSIREAALGVGASRLQMVFHHVLPLAIPGILTGSIIGMAQALGETAPLLMIGMVAFIVDIPGSVMDPSTVLPVQIYLWADSPERAFVERTSAAIMVLLAFLITMNALAVLLRKKFERRW
jgi:phosphate transport system permease protein